MSEIDISKLPKGGKGFVHDFAADQTVFKGVPWGKSMMWIFLLSDTLIFSCFLYDFPTNPLALTGLFATSGFSGGASGRVVGPF